MRILHLNVQSIISKIDKISLLLLDKKPDIVSIAEHWCKEEGMEVVRFPGYKMVSYFCRPTREHGGSAIFARDEMEVKIIHINKFSEELVCECCAVKFKIGQHSIGVISAYRPPTGNFESFLIKMAYIA